MTRLGARKPPARTEADGLACQRAANPYTARMQFLSLRGLLAAALCLGASWAGAASHVTINSDLVLVIDGRKVFPIGFTTPPPPEGRTPEGRNGIGELAAAGATFMRTGAGADGWNDAAFEREQKYLDAAARYGLHCLPYLREDASLVTEARAAQLAEILRRFKDHPGLGAWKGEDEPEWGKAPLAPLLAARAAIKAADPNHPMVIIQAPRGTVESLRRYNGTGDILGMDIYPVSYPPGIHSLLTNRTLSLVGDHTRIIMDAAEGKLPVWMVLQISWSGVLNPGKTLRFPTFAEERFMTYEAIINGARGLLFFGGNNLKAMTPADRELGWNWTFWRRVLRPVIEEIGTRSPLYPALVAAESKLPVRVTGAAGMEYCVRQVGAELFILACKREGPTAKVEFSGLPMAAGTGEVLYESPRRVEVKEGKFSDWFGPFEVHVYRLSNSQ
jgi:hypothetical protein